MSFVRYPPPPPTTNSLTPEERNHLLRSSKKLAKVLGTTPHLIDGSHNLGTVHVTLSIQPPKQKGRLDISYPISDMTPRRSPSISSESSFSDDSSDARTSLSSATSYTDSVNSSDSWRVRKQIRKPPPLLRLTSTTVQGPPSAIASVKPALETIPASPPAQMTTTYDDSSSSDSELALSRQSTRSISFAAFGRPTSRPPSFEIPTDASLRWVKMERLRRKLGDEVPAALVFPSEEDGYVEVEHEVIDEEVLPPTPKPASPIPGASFSLERPIFAIVEGPDDHVSGCFEFRSRKERATFRKLFGGPGR